MVDAAGGQHAHVRMGLDAVHDQFVRLVDGRNQAAVPLPDEEVAVIGARFFLEGGGRKNVKFGFQSFTSDSFNIQFCFSFVSSCLFFFFFGP